MRGILKAPWLMALLTAAAFGQPASQDAKNTISDLWAKNPGVCLNALDLVSGPKHDKTAALAALSASAPDPRTLELLTPDMKDKLWDWLATSVKTPPPDTAAVEAASYGAMQAIDAFYKGKRKELLGVYTNIQSKDDLRAVYGLLQLANDLWDAPVTGPIMGNIRIAYGANKQQLFGYVLQVFR